MGILEAMADRLINAWIYPDLKTIISEYADTFITPLHDRATQLGIPEDESADMWRKAVAESSPENPPGAIMRRLLDEWQPKETEGE